MAADSTTLDIKKSWKIVGREELVIRFRNWNLAVKPHWPTVKPLVWGAMATILASASRQSVEAQAGLSVFAALSISKSAWEALCRLRAKKRPPAGRKAWQRRKPQKQFPQKQLVVKRLQLNLKAVRRQASEAIMEAETLRLERDHLEARCQRSEALREQLHGSFTSVLSRLERCESDEARLRQEILRMTALAVPGSFPPGKGPGGLGQELEPPGFTYAPSTPSSCRKIGNGSGGFGLAAHRNCTAPLSPAESSRASLQEEDSDEDPEEATDARMSDDDTADEVTCKPSRP